MIDAAKDLLALHLLDDPVPWSVFKIGLYAAGGCVLWLIYKIMRGDR